MSKVIIPAAAGDYFTADTSVTKGSTPPPLLYLQPPPKFLSGFWLYGAVTPTDTGLHKTHPDLSEGKIPPKSRQSPRRGICPAPPPSGWSCFLICRTMRAPACPGYRIVPRQKRATGRSSATCGCTGSTRWARRRT